MQDVLNWINNTYKEAIPANARMAIKSVVNPSTVTENNFTKDELNTIRKTYQNSQQRTRSPKAMIAKQDLNAIRIIPSGAIVSDGKNTRPIEDQRQMLKAKFSPTIQYADYPTTNKYKNYSVSETPIQASFNDKGYSLSTTLGRALYDNKNGNINITDTYNFPKGNKMENYNNWSNAFKIAHLLGEKFSNSMPVDINLRDTMEKH